MACGRHIPRRPWFVILLWGLAFGATRFSVWAQETEATTHYAAAAALQNRGEYALAADEWQGFIRKFPGEPRAAKAYHYLGVCYYQAGKHAEAVKTFQAVLTRFPNLELLDATYLYLAASQFALAQAGQTGMYQQALATLDTLLAKFPQSASATDALYYRGECLYALGKKAEAIQSYTALVAKDRQHRLAPEATYAVGVAREELGEMEAAGKVYEAFLARYPEHRLAAEVELRRAETLLATGQAAEAVQRFAAAAARPNFALADLALVRQADALSQLKRHAEAAQAYAAVAQRFPQSKYIARALLAGGKSFYLAGDYTQARKLLESVPGAELKDRLEAGHWIARSLLKEHRPQEALAHIEPLLAAAGSAPQAAELLLDQADALYDLPGRRAEAAQRYAAVAAKYPQDPIAPQALYLAAFTALETGDPQTAVRHAQQFLKAYAQHTLRPDVSALAAEAMLQTGAFAQAESLYATLVRDHPDHPDAERWKVRQAAALFGQKRFADTLAALEPVVASLKSPEPKAEALYLLGSSRLEEKQYAAAVPTLEASLASQPRGPHADHILLALGRAHLALAQTSGKTEHAQKGREALQRLVRDFPQSPLLDQAYYRLGQCALHQGEPRQAASEFGRVLAGWPQSPLAPHALFEQAGALLDAKDPAGAEAALGSFLERFGQHPLAPQARYARALARHQSAKYALAIEDLQQALRGLQDKPLADARFLLGLCQIELKQYAAAADSFATILRDQPTYPDADKVLYQWAWALKLQGEDREAAAHFRKLAAEHPQSPLASEAQYHVGESAFAAKDYTAAALAYYAVIEKEDGTPLGEKAVYKLAWCYYHQENFADAQKSFAYQRQRFRTGPLAGDAAFMEAECLFKLARWAEALKAYEALPALENREFRALAALHAGQAAGQLAQWEVAARHLAAGAEKFSDSPWAPEILYELGWAQQNLGRLPDAQATYQRAIAATDKVGRAGSEVAARAQFMIGEIQFQNKDHAEAVKSFFKVAYGYASPKWQAEATYEAARCFEVLNKKSQAARLYQELAEKYPQSDKVPLARERLAELAR